MIGILFFMCLLISCSSDAGREEYMSAGEAIRQAAFYEERLQYLPALETYQQVTKLAEKEKDSVTLSSAYRSMGNIYRKQSLKQEALQCEKRALSYINYMGDSLRMELYREIGDIYALSGEADSACYYYQIAGCRISQAKILQQAGNSKEAEILLKEELKQDISGEEKDELFLALADLKISLGKIEEAEDYLSHVSPFHPHLYVFLSRIAESRGDSLQASFYRKNYYHYLSTLRQEKEQNQIAQLLFTSEQKMWESRLSNAQKIQKGQSYLWIALLIFGGIGIWGYFRYRKRKTIVALSETEFQSSEVYQRFHTKEDWKPTPKDWEELMQAVNSTYPEFRERLKRKIPKLSEQEWRMCCLIKMDVPPSVTAMLLCCTNQAISMRRVRLYQKMTGEKGTPELCDALIRTF